MVDKTKGNVSWSIEVDSLMVVVYSAFVKDRNNVLKHNWEKQSTNDDVPDKFEITELSVAELAQGGRLTLIAITIDPSDKGGNYTATIKFYQNDKQIGKDYDFPGTVSPGQGSESRFSDIFKFQ